MIFSILPKKKNSCRVSENQKNLFHQKKSCHTWERVKWLNHLKTLHLDFTNCTGNFLYFKLKLPRLLSSLHLNVTEGAQTEFSLLRLTSKNHQLEHLTLNFHRQQREYEEAQPDPQFWISFFSQTPNLKSLNITKGFNEDTYSQDIQTFFSSFNLLKDLTSLSLEPFRDYPIDKSLKLTVLWSHFQHLTHLQKFHLKMFQEISDSDLKSLALLLQSFHNLKTLSLTRSQRHFQKNPKFEENDSIVTKKKFNIFVLVIPEVGTVQCSDLSHFISKNLEKLSSILFSI